MAVSRAVVLVALTVLGAALGSPAVAVADGNRVHFQACSRTPADPASTNLRARTVLDAEPDGAPYDFAPYAAEVTLEHGLDLVLPDGMLGSGAGYDAESGQSEQKPFRVAASTVTAEVTLAVADSPESGRRVAFVELRLAPEPPVSWVEETSLTIGTDGGDGGFFSTLNVAPYTGTSGGLTTPAKPCSREDVRTRALSAWSAATTFSRCRPASSSSPGSAMAAIPRSCLTRATSFSDLCRSGR